MSLYCHSDAAQPAGDRDHRTRTGLVQVRRGRGLTRTDPSDALSGPIPGPGPGASLAARIPESTGPGRLGICTVPRRMRPARGGLPGSRMPCGSAGYPMFDRRQPETNTSDGGRHCPGRRRWKSLYRALRPTRSHFFSKNKRNSSRHSAAQLFVPNFSNPSK